MTAKTHIPCSIGPPDPLQSALIDRLRRWLAWAQGLVSRYKPKAHPRSNLQMLLHRSAILCQWNERIVERIQGMSLGVHVHLAVRRMLNLGSHSPTGHAIPLPTSSVRRLCTMGSGGMQPVTAVPSRLCVSLFRSKFLANRNWARRATLPHGLFGARAMACSHEEAPAAQEANSVKRANGLSWSANEGPKARSRIRSYETVCDFVRSVIARRAAEGHVLSNVEAGTLLVRKTRRVEESPPGPVVSSVGMVRRRSSPPAPREVKPPAGNDIRGSGQRTAATAPRPQEIPAVNVTAITDEVMRRLDRRMSVWRERTGRA